MRYPSLKAVNLIVIDGRSSSEALQKCLAGALLALARRYDGHILVVASSKETSDRYEAMGEISDLDFFFHSEPVETSEQFLELCATARMVIVPAPSPVNADELSQLEQMERTVVLIDGDLDSIPRQQQILILKISDPNPIEIMELILNTSPESKRDG